jgi:hypothetical protein
MRQDAEEIHGANRNIRPRYRAPQRESICRTGQKEEAAQNFDFAQQLGNKKETIYGAN